MARTSIRKLFTIHIPILFNLADFKRWKMLTRLRYVATSQVLSKMLLTTFLGSFHCSYSTVNLWLQPCWWLEFPNLSQLSLGSYLSLCPPSFLFITKQEPTHCLRWFNMVTSVDSQVLLKIMFLFIHYIIYYNYIPSLPILLWALGKLYFIHPCIFQALAYNL